MPAVPRIKVSSKAAALTAALAFAAVPASSTVPRLWDGSTKTTAESRSPMILPRAAVSNHLVAPEFDDSNFVVLTRADIAMLERAAAIGASEDLDYSMFLDEEDV